MKYALTEYCYPYRDFLNSPDLFQARQFISLMERLARIGKTAYDRAVQNGSCKIIFQSEPGETFHGVLTHAFVNCHRLIVLIGADENEDAREYAEVSMHFIYKRKKKPFTVIRGLVNLRTGTVAVKCEVEFQGR